MPFVPCLLFARTWSVTPNLSSVSSTFSTLCAIPLAWSYTQESDRWYRVLSRTQGKIEFRARGANKPLAKLTPHLEFLGIVDVLLVQGRHYPTLIGVDRQVAFPNMVQDVSKLILARNALHFIDLCIRPEEPDEALFFMTKDFLLTIEQGGELTRARSEFLLGGFVLKLIGHLGYQPQLDECLVCRSSIRVNTFRFHPLKGGVVCDPCMAHDMNQWFSARVMDPDVLKLMRFAMNETSASHMRPRLSRSLLSGFTESVESLILSHFPVIPANSISNACCI